MADKVLFVAESDAVVEALRPLLAFMAENAVVHLAAPRPTGAPDPSPGLDRLGRDCGFTWEVLPNPDLVFRADWRTGSRAGSHWLRLWDEFRIGALVRWRIKRLVNDLIERHQPRVVVVSADTRLFESLLIEQARRRGIYTVCFQWTLPDMFEDVALRRWAATGAFSGRFPRLFKAARYLVHKFNGSWARLLDLRVTRHFTYHRRHGISVYGQGQAHRLAATSEASRDFYVRMGTPPEKIAVIGHPLYDELHAQALAGTTDSEERRQVCARLGLPADGRYILWANNANWRAYRQFYSPETMVESWRQRIGAILAAIPEVDVVFKAHPYMCRDDENDAMTTVSPRVKLVIKDDITPLIRHAEAVVTQYSTSAVTALTLGKPVFTFNDPPLPLGDFFQRVGGAIHEDDVAAMTNALARLLAGDPDIAEQARRKRETFLTQVLGIDLGTTDSRPACHRFLALLQDEGGLRPRQA